MHMLTGKVPGANKFHFQEKCGLPLATYFSAVKYRWILDHSTPEIKEALKKGTLRFGTIDTWLIWVIPPFFFFLSSLSSVFPPSSSDGTDL